MNPLSLVIITDTHYYSKKNWVAGNPYAFPPKREQQYRRGSEEIIKYVFDEICNDGEPEIVLISGDLTNNGEYTSHEEMRELLRQLQARGKNVFVTTATHDYRQNENAYGYDENHNQVPVPAFTREMLYDYYTEFSFDKALSVHMPSMCYTAQLADGYRLLALNDDHGKDHAGYDDDCLKWIEEQVELAHKDNQFIVAMTHHPVLTPSPLYKIIGPRDLLEDGEERAKQFADMGIPCIFTGHSHIQNITSIKSEKGNVCYDVSTSALVGFPPYYRHATINPDERKISVSSVLIKDVPGLDTEGMPLSDYTKKLFLGVVEDMLNSAEHDYPTFQELAIGMSISKEKSAKLKPVIRPVAKVLNRLSFGKVWRLTRLRNGVSRKEIAPIKKKLAVPFITDVVSNLYKGDADLDVNSPEYKVAVGFLKTADSLTKPFKKKLNSIGIESVSALIMPLLHKEGIGDSDAELEY